MKKFHQAAGANNLFSVSQTVIHTGFCKQMGYIFWDLEPIWFSHNCFIKVNWVKTNLSLKFPCLSLPSTSTKLLIQGNCLVPQGSELLLVTSGQSPYWELLSNAKGIGQQGLFWCDTGSHLNMIWWPRKASNTIKNIRMIARNLFFYL